MISKLIQHIPFVALLIVLLLNTSCDNDNGVGSKPFTLKCEDFTGERDSITLYLYEEPYQAWREAGSSAIVSQRLQIAGSVYGAQIARLDFNNHKKSFFFIVEPGLTSIEFHRGHTTIQGGAENHKYFVFKNRCDSINKEIINHERRRIQLSADTASWAHIEIKRLMKADSVLHDSLNAMTKSILSIPGMPAKLVENQYGNIAQ